MPPGGVAQPSRIRDALTGRFLRMFALLLCSMGCSGADRMVTRKTLARELGESRHGQRWSTQFSRVSLWLIGDLVSCS